MQSSEGVRHLLQDQHLLDRARPSTAMGVKSRTTRPARARPTSAPATRPEWRNPNSSPEMKKRRKFHVSLYHNPLESSVSKKAPYAARTKVTSGSTMLPGREFSSPGYNSLSDPHLDGYFTRKFGFGGENESSARRKVKYSASGKMKKQGGNVLYKVLVKTGDKKGCGTNAKVFCEFCGVNGKFRRHLTHQVEAGVPAAFVATLAPFEFTPGSKDMFNVKGPDIGDMRYIVIEHDGKERKQGWFLDEVAVTHNKAEQKWSFPCNQWLSLYEHDCAVSRRLKPVVHRKPIRTVYVIEVETGDKAGAGTDAHVFVTLFGKNGKTPKTQLINRNEDTFERNRTDVFKIKITELGPLTKLIVEHDNFGFSAGWYLNKITVYERENSEKKYYFPCNQWLATDEGDGRIVRDLTATTDSKSGRQEFNYVVHTYTGDRRGAGTDADVTVIVFGHDGDSGEHKLDNARNNFERSKKDTFKVSCGSYLGDLTKVRIGHDNSGLGPGWFLEKVTVEDSKTGQLYDFMCRRWLSRTEDDGQITRELVLKGLEDMDAGIPYEVSMTTGDVRNAGTDARVYVIMHGGEDGNENSGKIWLDNGEKDNFQRGRTDIFKVETTSMLSPLHHLTMGHDNSGLGSGFYCEKVVIDCPSSGVQQVFLCQKWLADDEDDKLIERDLYESEDMRITRGEKQVWNVGVWTSDIRGAGTDANVFVTLYGKKGKSEEIPLGNRTDNFEEGQMDKFKVEVPKIGTPYKLRIRHDNNNAFPGWHLERVQIQNAKSNDKFSFKCDRWLSKDEDDHQVIRELPALGANIEPLPVYIYRVFVHTGNKRGAGTDADVFITIFGEMGDTGERPLKSSKDNTNKFERNETDEFEIEAVCLKKLRKIRIGHNGKGSGSAWYLNKVLISDPEENTKAHEFPCERWLAKDEDDGLTTRELLCGKASLLNTTSYHVCVRTGDVVGAGTDADVYMILQGDQGDTGRLNLKQANNTKNKFERGRTDEFTLEAVDIGQIQKIFIGHDNKGGGAAWFLEDVVVDIPSRGEKAVFPCHRWLAEKEDDGKIERELYPVEIQQSSSKIPYEVVVYTGDVRGAGTNANVVLVMYGEKGKSEEFSLRNKSDNFERNEVDKFKVECDDIGPLTKIRIGHDNAKMSSAWFLDKVEIRRMKPGEDTKSKKKKQDESLYDYLFVCNRWLAKDEDDGQTMRELVPMDSTGSKPLNDALAENTYRVHIFTGDVANAGTNSNVFITLYGDLGDSGERKLDKSETHLDKFERSNEDIFTIICVNLGPLSKAKIRHDNSGLKPAWNVDRVETEDKLADKTTAFPCGRWLATSEDDGQICRELVAVDLEGYNMERQRSIKRKSSLRRESSPLALVDGVDLENKARTNTYEVTVVTGDVKGAGTDANVYIVMYGTEGDTGKIPLKTSQSNKNKFERNQSDVFNIDAKVGEVKKIRIGHDNKGGFAGWFLDKVIINVPSLGQNVVFPCGRWLDKDEDDGKLERELNIAEDSAQVYRPHVPYEITVYTSDMQGAGTSANVFIVLCGVEGSTKDVLLADTDKKKKGSFNRGSVDQFVKELDDVGPVIEKIRIGHDNKGLASGWHLEKVEIRRLSDEEGSSTTHTFPCNTWLAKNEGDGAIIRELVPQKVVEETVCEDGEVETKEVEQYALDMHKYEVHVFTGDVKMAGTDANVFMTIFGEYGDTGDRQLAKSSMYSDKFERGHEDIFSIEAADLGNVYKIKLRHDNTKLNASWFVDRIEIRDLETDKLYAFIIERWLSKKKEDQKIERSFYVKGYEGDRSTLGTLSGRSIGHDSLPPSPRSSLTGSPRSTRRSFRGSTDNLSVKEPVRSALADQAFAEEYGKKEEDAVITNRPMISYTVRATTGDQTDAGTDAKAYIVLIGCEGVSEKIPLELVQQKNFQPGITETFSVEAVDVGKVSKLEVGHDGYGPSSGWLVKDIEVDVPTEGTKYFFPCNRWLSRDKDDGKTTRILSASSDKVMTYKPHVRYEMTVYTGDVTSAGTDSNISFCLFGTEGSTPEMPLEKEESRFERAVVDVIPLECEDVGKLVKMRMKIDGTGSRPSWFLEKILLRNTSTNTVDKFVCNQWLSKNEGKLDVEIPCEAEDGESKTIKKTTYTIRVKTGDVSGAGTDANVFIILFGQYGDCGELALKQSETFKDKFERNHTDVFVFKNIYSLGELSKVRIWHDNKFLGASWFLEYVEVIDEPTKASYMFPCKRWLSKDKDDKSLIRELTCSTGSRVSLNKGATLYEVTILTSDKQNAGTTQNASIILEGENGTSKELIIENSATNKVLRRGQTDTISMKSKPLGPLTHVTLGHVRKKGANVKGTGKETAWFVHEVIVQNEETGKFVFPCRQWIPLGDGRDDNTVRLECKSSEKNRINTLRDLQPVKYLLDVYTADVHGAGTDANVHITIYGSNGDTGRRPLTKKLVDLFERSKKDSFNMEALDLGSLTRVRIEHDNKGFKAGWMLSKIDVTNTVTQECVTFPCNQWLDKKKGDGKICRDLFPLAS